MATLLEAVQQSVTPVMLSTLGQELDLDEQMVQRGLNVSAPLVQGGLAETSATPPGLDGLVQMMPAIAAAVEGGDVLELVVKTSNLYYNRLARSATGRLLAELLGGLLAGGAGGGDGAPPGPGGLLGSLFGEGLGSINAMLNQRLGFKASPLLTVVAPLVVHQVSKLMKEQNLGTEGITVLLQKEHQAFLETGGETAAFVQQALYTGKEAAALKQKFSSEEWTALRLGPLAAAAIVMQAAPSGVVGRIQEITAAVSGVAESAARTSPASLLQTAFATALSPDDFKRYTPETPYDQLLKAVQNAVALVAAKAPASVADYNQMMIIVAAKVAEAAKEGGFLGIGGEQVSNAEKAALAGIAAALGELG
jgi:hypothetical protein